MAEKTLFFIPYQDFFHEIAYFANNGQAIILKSKQFCGKNLLHNSALLLA
jgi:hypothetical protein